MSDFKFGAVNIFELGDIIDKKLTECGVEGESVMTVTIPNDKFKKVDEDMFYRMRENEDDEFIPSDDEIIIQFSDKVKIIIKKDK